MRRSESGNAIVFILIGIALFAALAATFMRGSKTGQGNLTTQQTKLYVSEVSNYLANVARGVEKVRNKGCSENQISFEKAPFDGSDTTSFNSNSPSDFSCHIFHANGGGVSQQDPPAALMYTASTRYVFTGVANVSGFGNVGTNDLVAMFIDVSRPFCLAYNKGTWNFTGTPYVTGGNYTVTNFKGTFPVNTTAVATASGDPISGQPTACITRTGTPDVNTVYFLLLQR